ncbi:MAG: rhodanese-like domain-containing protein [Candidatus Aminicenantes bacterium]|nr:rhodanese-like domain-containing protein [Candidatus Aminicenantes bacterium]
MKKASAFFMVFCVGCVFSCGQDVRNISSKEGFEMLKKSATYLVDVRTIAEYVYVGHPVMASNIPLLFWMEREQDRIQNPNFLEDVKSLFKTDDTLILICRSGVRSVTAYRMLEKAGFKNVYNIKNGFEGGRDENGYRSMSGWKNNGLAYNYNLDVKLIYKFPEK